MFYIIICILRISLITKKILLHNVDFFFLRFLFWRPHFKPEKPQKFTCCLASLFPTYFTSTSLLPHNHSTFKISLGVHSIVVVWLTCLLMSTTKYHLPCMWFFFYSSPWLNTESQNPFRNRFIQASICLMQCQNLDVIKLMLSRGCRCVGKLQKYAI